MSDDQLTGQDLSSMQPGDAAVALRTFPRRFRDAARSAVVDLDDEPDPAKVDELTARVGPDGYSALDLVRTASEHVTTALGAVRSGLVSDSTSVPAVLATRPTVDHQDSGDRLDPLVERLATATEELADEVERADPYRWETELRIEGGGTTTPLRLLRETVASLVTWERDLSRTLRAVRGRGAR